MYLPDSISEKVFLAATEKVICVLAHSFAFGPFSVEDIKQQARLFAIQSMDKYDISRPLDNFLYAHVKNRLINFRRDNFRRNDPPCKGCHSSVDGETAHTDKKYCIKYVIWMQRNTVKQNIISPLDISNIDDEDEKNTRRESTVVDDLIKQELLSLIDMRLDVELRSTYLQMQVGENVPKAKREAVEKAVLDIIKDNDECLLN